MKRDELRELMRPLTELEKAELSAACQKVLKPKGMMLLRRLLFQCSAPVREPSKEER